MKTYTPGPWHVHDEAGRLTTVYAGRSIADKQICDMCLVAQEGDSDLDTEEQADARLIAAAPTYHEACTGKQFPDIPTFEWAAGIIADFRRLLEGKEPVGHEQDPDAAWTALTEAEALIDGLRAAYAKAEGSEPK